ncbi:MAG: TraR/DksA family transcriptional regulator, partial [Myxococcales bacterium]|nr:TraR/DksA family transcriptional regulator [Myxococcales bacterium]
MEHLTSEQIGELRRRLEDERRALLERAGAFVSESADFSVDSGDRQDQAALEAARAAVAGLATHDREQLAEIEAALQRIVAGTYGVCEESDEPIPFARLRLQPTARYTVEAQAELEREARR